MGNNEDDKCAICILKVKDDEEALCCGDCIKWSHRICLNMSKTVYKKLENSEEEWLCNPCKSKNNVSQNNSSGNNNKIKNKDNYTIGDIMLKLNKMEQEMIGLRNSVTYMSNAFDEQKILFEKSVNEINSLKKENTSLKQRLDFLETKFEEQEQKEKTNNVVIVGVPKQNHPDTTKIVSSIFSTLQLSLSRDDVRECYRLGKQGNGPILVKFYKQETKKA